jgi:hypothetical protein
MMELTERNSIICFILLTVLTLIVLVLLGLVIYNELAGPESINNLRVWFAQRDANCTCCLEENNYSVALHDYNNMTPYILNKCPDCRMVTMT